MNNANSSTFIVAAGIVRRPDGAILLTQRPKGKWDAGLWEFPGGKLEPGEAPEAALQRELQEELGLEVLIDGIDDVIHHTYEWGSVLLLFYRCRPLNRLIEHRDVADHAWVPPQRLKDFEVLPADAPLVDKLMQQHTTAPSLAPHL